MCNEGLEPLVRLLLRMWSDKSLFFSFFFFPFSFLANVHLLYIDIITWGVRSAISFFLFFSFFLLFLQKTNFYIPVSFVLSPKERIRYTPRAHVLDNPNISPSSNTSLHPSSSSSPLPSSSIRKLTNPDKEEKNCQLIIIIKLVHAQCPLYQSLQYSPLPFPLSSSETAVLLSPLNSPSWEVGGKRCSDSGAALEGGILAVGSWTRIACYTQESPAEAAVELGGTFTVAVAAEPSGTPTPSATHWPAAGTLGATPEPTTAP